MRPERGPQDFLYGHMSICGHMAICPYDHMAIRVSGLVSNPKCPSLTDLQVLAALIDRLESPLSRLKPQTSSFSLSLSELLPQNLTNLTLWKKCCNVSLSLSIGAIHLCSMKIPVKTDEEESIDLLKGTVRRKINDSLKVFIRP